MVLLNRPCHSRILFGEWAQFYIKRMSIRRGLVRRLNKRDGSAAMAPAARPRRSFHMRFMYIVTSAHPGPPTPELLEAMHKLAEREIKASLVSSMALSSRLRK